MQVPFRRFGYRIYKLTGGVLPRSLYRELDASTVQRADALAGSAHTLIGGEVIYRVHDPRLCAGEVCCVHNPSDHHMAAWRQRWRSDRGLMERICPHGIGHPDPDQMAFLDRLAFAGRRDVEDVHAEGVHGCDGCCDAPEIPRAA